MRGNNKIYSHQVVNRHKLLITRSEVAFGVTLPTTNTAYSRPNAPYDVYTVTFSMLLVLVRIKFKYISKHYKTSI